MKTWPWELPFCAQSECVPTLSMESITTDLFSVCHCHCCWLNKPTRLPRHTVWFCLYISSSPFRALWAQSVNVDVFCMLCTLRWHMTLHFSETKCSLLDLSIHHLSHPTAISVRQALHTALAHLHFPTYKVRLNYLLMWSVCVCLCVHVHVGMYDHACM